MTKAPAPFPARGFGEVAFVSAAPGGRPSEPRTGSHTKTGTACARAQHNAPSRHSRRGLPPFGASATRLPADVRQPVVQRDRAALGGLAARAVVEHGPAERPGLLGGHLEAEM